MDKMKFTPPENLCAELEQDMRDWLLDCFSDDYDQELIKELSKAGLIKAVNLDFDGGYNAFILSMGMV